MSLIEDAKEYYKIIDLEKEYQLFKQGKLIISYEDNNIGNVYAFIYQDKILVMPYDNYRLRVSEKNKVYVFLKGKERYQYDISSDIQTIIDKLKNNNIWNGYKYKNGKYYKISVFLKMFFGNKYVGEYEIDENTIIEEIISFFFEKYGIF